MDSHEKDLQLAHKQDVKKQLLYTDLPLFSQNFSDICLGVGGFYVGGSVLEEYFLAFVRGFLSAQHHHRVRTEDKNFENKKGQVT